MAQAGALAHDTLLPRPPGGNAPGAALALLVHAGLLAALSFSVDWRAQTPDVVSAELWASVPVAAAPAAAEPTPAPAPTPKPAPVPTPAPPKPAPAPPPPQAAPAPAEPDIAAQRAERRKQEAERKQALAEEERLRAADARKRADDARKQREQAAQAERTAREAKADEERLARQREENLRRMMSQAGGATAPTTSSGTAAQSAAPSQAYTGRLVALIRGNLVFAGEMPADNNAAEVEVSAGPSGTIISRKLVKSSGHADWDEAVLRAIDRTRTLPRDVDGRVPPRLLIAFRPRD